MKKLLLLPFLLVSVLSFGQDSLWVQVNTPPSTSPSFKIYFKCLYDCNKTVHVKDAVYYKVKIEGYPDSSSFDFSMSNNCGVKSFGKTTAYDMRLTGVVKLIIPYYPSTACFSAQNTYSGGDYLNIEWLNPINGASGGGNIHLYIDIRPTISGIENDFKNDMIEFKSFFYNLNGIEIKNPDNYEGVLIRKVLYNNQTVSTKKLYFSKNN